MSVLVKGMDMPKHCADKCPLMENGRCWGVKNQPEPVVIAGHRPSWCPLIELPVPHGKLIDAYAFVSDLIFPNESFEQAFKAMVDDAPTVIEAEE